MPNIADQDTARKCLFVVFAFFSLLLCITAYVAYDNYRLLVNQPLLPSGASSQIFEVKPNTSATTLVKSFRAHQWIRSSHVLSALIRWRGAANRLQAGIYQINPGDSLINLLDRILKGQVLIEPFRILEGSTLKELRANLAKAPYLHFNPSDLSQIAESHQHAEGLFLAETYYYKAGSQSLSLLKQSNQQLLQYLDQVWKTRDAQLPYRNAYELLIAASIIEKEAAIPTERRIISGIIVNRLKKYMPLQMDPTVIYALNLKSEPPIISLHHQDLSIDSPYNTYLHRGLPPSPIAMVGRQSLDAAANPIHSNYLYFYAKGDGSHQFSETYQAQQKAIQQFKPSRTKAPL